MKSTGLSVKILKIVILGLAMQPIVYLVLSPYMVWIVGLTWDQLVTWWWTALPMGIALNLVLAVYIPWVAPKIDRLFTGDK